MEGSGAPFGRGLGRVLGGVWRLWGSVRAFFGVIFPCLYLGWSSEGFLEASWLDFGSILGGLEGILGGFGERFGVSWRLLAALEPIGGFWRLLASLNFNWRLLAARGCLAALSVPLLLRLYTFLNFARLSGNYATKAATI